MAILQGALADECERSFGKGIGMELVKLPNFHGLSPYQKERIITACYDSQKTVRRLFREVYTYEVEIERTQLIKKLEKKLEEEKNQLKRETIISFIKTLEFLEEKKAYTREIDSRKFIEQKGPIPFLSFCYHFICPLSPSKFFSIPGYIFQTKDALGNKTRFGIFYLWEDQLLFPNFDSAIVISGKIDVVKFGNFNTRTIEAGEAVYLGKGCYIRAAPTAVIIAENVKEPILSYFASSKRENEGIDIRVGETRMEEGIESIYLAGDLLEVWFFPISFLTPTLTIPASFLEEKSSIVIVGMDSYSIIIEDNGKRTGDSFVVPSIGYLSKPTEIVVKAQESVTGHVSKGYMILIREVL